MFKVSGTLIGERKVKYKESMVVVDLKNDLLAFINMETDDRGFFTKIIKKKSSYPDYFRYNYINI